MIGIAILIKLTSPGPMFYTQTRIGLNRRLLDGSQPRSSRRRACDLGGRPFVIYKFRTMRANAENGSGAVWAEQNDPRITWLGKMLRQTRLDELPQFINVLKGDMNVVGPRPERPSIFARLADELEEYPLRQAVRPGITGLAQISQQYDSNLDDVRRKLIFDLEYIEAQGFWTDAYIMLKTVPVILFRKGGW
jgi:lipopolysaccharide/colanic/teichoic acid biosynthesis glycosyltransferase